MSLNQSRPLHHKPPFRITPRDIEILQALGRYRYLRTSQVKDLLFADNTTLQACRRRLRALFAHGYIGRIHATAPAGLKNPEYAFYVEQDGRDALAGGGAELPIYAHGRDVKYMFLAHALDVSQFRLDLERALVGSEIASLHRFIADHELKENLIGLAGRKRYRLFDQVIHPVSRDPYIVYPDALVVLKGMGKFVDLKRLYCVEIDRGTEGLKIIREKVIGYHLYRAQKAFAKWGIPDGFRVLIQTNSARRADNMRKALLETSGHELVWITHHELVNPSSILNQPIWTDTSGDQHSIIKQPKE